MVFVFLHPRDVNGVQAAPLYIQMYVYTYSMQPLTELFEIPIRENKYTVGGLKFAFAGV